MDCSNITMRRDIEIHINTGDITLTSKNKAILRDFQWLEGTPTDMEQRYLYGEVTVPAYVLEDSIFEQGVYIEIPYTPIYKEIKLRIKREYTQENVQYLRNPKDGSEWFLVQCKLYGDQAANIFASQLMSVSEDRFYLSFTGGIILLYSGHENDMTVVKANTQNKNMLLKCVPGNNYRYPLTGVGLIRWTNSNISVTKLAQVLKEQFAADGTPVINAKYDFDNKQLHLMLDTSNVDGDGDI